MDAQHEIKAIVFDAYGTLFDIASIDLRLQHHFGARAEQIGPVWRRKQLEYTWLRTLMVKYKDFYSLTADALVFACKHAGVDLSAEVSEDLMQHYNRLDVFEEVPTALKGLSQNYQLAILSNANPELLEKAVLHNRIKSHLNVILSAHTLRQFKPVPSVYQLPVSYWNLEKEAILFCSSNTWDVSGAKAFGLQVAWINRYKGQVEQLGYSPDLMVHDLQQLAEVIGA